MPIVVNRIRLSISLVIIINALGLLEPLLRNDDPTLYANIAKQIVLHNNWVDLISGGANWLDKPHFPFWMAALSFKIFGINAFAYVLPGFLFHLLGACYTYRLAKYMYTKEVALIATLIYLTSLHLMLSAMDVRAEAYLLGEIMPACYYWIIYDKSSSLKALLLAAFFTGLALMTKGLFVAITIFSGLIITLIYTGQWRRIISLKWLAAYALCFICIIPELVCLYLQFDAHPEKVVFGQQNVSGLAWYFWGSQFGRFFNSGPIVNNHGNPFFFVHTYLWAFLPWSIVFIVAMYQLIRNFRKIQEKVTKAKQVYLLASFWLTFIMFSATKFQLDHYTNIIMPFAAILCANYLYLHRNLSMKLAQVQLGISLAWLVLIILLIIYLFGFNLEITSITLPIFAIVFILIDKGSSSYLDQMLIYPSISIAIVFMFLLLVYGRIYAQYDVGYNVAKIINNNPYKLVYDYNVNDLSLEFNSCYPYSKVSNINQLVSSVPYYLFIRKNDWQQLELTHKLPKLQKVASFCGATIDKIMAHYDNHQIANNYLECFEVLKHE